VGETEKFCAKNPYSLQELKDNIQREIVDISRQNLCLVSGNIFQRCEDCSEDGGGQRFETV
jgi:hypothetical protein